VFDGVAQVDDQRARPSSRAALTPEALWNADAAQQRIDKGHQRQIAARRAA
jgi:hypothetical protein